MSLRDGQSRSEEAIEDGTTAFFEQLLESMGIKPAQTVQQYAAGLVEAGASLADFEMMSLAELAKDYGFKKLHINRVEASRVADTAEAGSSPRTSERPSEGMTPRSARWDSVLQSVGPERRAALQEVLDGWHQGRWVIEERELGRGSGGVVLKRSDSDLGSIAIKFSFSDDPRRLHREVRLMKRVAHDRICQVHEHHVSADGRLFGMMLELLELGALSERIRDSTDGRIHEFEVVQMSFDVLAALQFMHEKKVIHRDIKTSNIMLTERDGRKIFKLIDFSIAAVEVEARESVSQTLATGTTSLKGLAGTPHYMSPEQFDGDIAVSVQTDIWSLGVVMFECLSGVLPFAATDHDRNRIAYAIVNKPAPELSDVIEEVGVVSEGMVAFVRHALQKDLARRFGTAAQMTAALEEMLTRSGDEKYGLFISYRVWCDKLFAEDLYTAASRCQLRPGREHRIKVYLDKVCIVDGQRFDVNFANGLANSTVFSPLVSASCLKNFVELGKTDKEDFVLAEWIMALELQKQGIVKAILPIVMGEQSTDGKYSQTFFESVRDGRVSWPASDGFHEAGSGTIPDVVSVKSVAKAREFLGMLDPPVKLSEDMTVKAVVDGILTFQAALLHFENDSIDNAAAGLQQVKVSGSHGGNLQKLARQHVAQICAQRIATIVHECEQVSIEYVVEQQTVQLNRPALLDDTPRKISPRKLALPDDMRQWTVVQSLEWIVASLGYNEALAQNEEVLDALEGRDGEMLWQTLSKHEDSNVWGGFVALLTRVLDTDEQTARECAKTLLKASTAKQERLEAGQAEAERLAAEKSEQAPLAVAEADKTETEKNEPAAPAPFAEQAEAPAAKEPAPTVADAEDGSTYSLVGLQAGTPAEQTARECAKTLLKASTAEQERLEAGQAEAKRLAAERSEQARLTVEEAEKTEAEEKVVADQQEPEAELEDLAPADVGVFYSLSELQASVPAGVDATRKQDFLSPFDFEATFEMDKVAFAKLPKWKQQAAKRKVGLF